LTRILQVETVSDTGIKKKPGRGGHTPLTGFEQAQIKLD
jgi:hypothetical protein